jgi:hypothetical protein
VLAILLLVFPHIYKLFFFHLAINLGDFFQHTLIYLIKIYKHFHVYPVIYSAITLLVDI